MGEPNEPRRSDAVDRGERWTTDTGAGRRPGAWLPVVGWGCIGLGVVLVVLGWYGVSGESDVAKQLPYLASGGIGGLAAVVVGVGLLCVHALGGGPVARGPLGEIDRQVGELHAVLLARPDAPARSQTSDPAPEPDARSRDERTDQADLVVLVVADGESFHRHGCALVEGKSSRSLDPSTAEAEGLRPCLVCEPIEV